MVRTAVFVLLTLAANAVVGGACDAFGLSPMAPDPAAALMAHLAWRAPPLPLGVGLSVLAGYLLDLETGGIVGLSALSYGLAYLVLGRVALRLREPSTLGRALWPAAVALWNDLSVALVLGLWLPWVSWADLAGAQAVDAVLWHVAATGAVGPAVWWVADGVERRVGLSRGSLERAPWPEGRVG